MTAPVLEETYGDKIKARREHIKMDRAAFAAALGKPTQDIEALEENKGAPLTLDTLTAIAGVLGTSLAELTPEFVSDLDDGVSYQLPQDNPIIKGLRAGTNYYTYHCLVRTRTVPKLVPLLLEVNVDDPDAAAFNVGHDAHEVIYCMEGDIHFKWGDPANPREVILPQGSSFYISPGVPHTLTTTKGSGPGKVISINF
ncbi:2-hydroxypropylphosphonic acid epoxidase [Spongiactinospora gelatinilytica]|uniref:2-hydroxypropylphosphonic acid epoxidase n=1 Tax=Spongiactinospora gelatinilytica TaxID=2666298 RepID=A0A2W2H3R2_9ACTN|nr:cupin domain-containing protein [Spongiactinospora gelatinilytica]PZG56666.1 2-hydroxypropylphosphonic acid epoxidase [Spongiactinospora gelatinilytica]